MRIALRHCYPVLISASLVHWKPNGTHHGPKSNPRLVAASLVRLGAGSPNEGWRLWVYLRGGYAWFGDIYIDRC